jgi:hypothetical protein
VDAGTSDHANTSQGQWAVPNAKKASALTTVTTTLPIG